MTPSHAGPENEEVALGSRAIEHKAGKQQATSRTAGTASIAAQAST
jgi:hypothetical protein